MSKYVNYADPNPYPYVNKTKSLENEIDKLTAESLILRDMYLEIWDELIRTRVGRDMYRNEKTVDITIEDFKSENEKLRDANRKINDYCNELEDENMMLKDKIDILSNQLEAKNKEVEELSKEHDKYESRIDELGELLRAYNKKQSFPGPHQT